MLSALSNISAAAHQLAAGRAQPIRERTATAAAALAALTPVQPVPSVSDPFDEDGFGFLYGPSGLPSGGAVPTRAAEAAPRIADETAPARLAMESTELSALLSSLMAPKSAVPTDGNAALPKPADTPQQSLITTLYRQF
jgi:hypothetical protein